MIETILIEDFEKIYDGLPFPYRSYEQWRNDEIDLSHVFLTVGSSTAEIRPRTEWNTLGREIYNVEALERHADIVSQILGEFELTGFFVQQILPTGAWFHGNTQ